MEIKTIRYQVETPDNQIIDGQLIKGYVALYVTDDYWILAKGYSLYKYNPETGVTIPFAQLKDPKSAFAAKFRLTRRALRAEVTHLYNFSGEWYCIARKAIFKLNKSSNIFEICRKITRGSRPMNLCQDSYGTIFYGEYFFNPERKSVNVYKSTDGGISWQIAYTFEAGEINHIHGIFNDPYMNGLWIFTGDEDSACIAAYSEDGFTSLNKQFVGEQKYRVCVPLFRDTDIVYATDSQYEHNTIRKISRTTRKIDDLQAIQGSGIYAVNTYNGYAVSTTVEPSTVNLDKASHLWFSIDGESWKEICSFRKDKWETTLFQFGSIRFPHYACASKYLVATGRAINTLDQSTLIIPITEINK